MQRYNQTLFQRKSNVQLTLEKRNCVTWDNTENVNIEGLLHFSNTFQRIQCETKLISKLGILVPFGMNKD